MLLFIGVVLLATVVVPAAWATPFKAAITPTSAGTGNTDAYTYTFTNTWSSSQKATKAEITVPSGWATPSLGAVTAEDGTWLATLAGGKIVLTASTGGLGYNKKLSIAFDTTATCTVGSSKWIPKLTRGSTVWGLTGGTPAVNVTSPGRLDHFAWTQQPGIAQTAGAAFGGTITAFDACNNVQTGYTGAKGSLTGLGTSPAPVSRIPDGLGAQTFASGVASVNVTDYLAETTQLTFVADGKPAIMSSSFTVVPGAVGVLSFVQQPSTSELAPAVIAPPVSIAAFDDWGNAATNAVGNVSLALATNPSDAALSGGSVPLSGGTATFPALSVSKVGFGFTLGASFGAASATSTSFDIANDVTPCVGSGCSGSATTANGQSTATSVAGDLPPGTLLTTTFLTGGPPPGVCTDFAPLGVGTEVIVTGGTPSLTVTYRIPSALIAPWKAGFLFNVCLGSKRVAAGVDPWLTKYLDFSRLPWKRKPAVPDGEERFWGVVPSCAFTSGEPLPWFPIPASNPCVISKARTGFLGLNGDLVMKVRIPPEWDPRGFVG